MTAPFQSAIVDHLATNFYVRMSSTFSWFLSVRHATRAWAERKSEQSAWVENWKSGSWGCISHRSFKWEFLSPAALTQRGIRRALFLEKAQHKVGETRWSFRIARCNYEQFGGVTEQSPLLEMLGDQDFGDNRPVVTFKRPPSSTAKIQEAEQAAAIKKWATTVCFRLYSCVRERL